MSQGEPSRGTILLVEDDEAYGEVLRETLAAAGYVVWIAADGVAAESAAESVRPDLVVIDLAHTDEQGLVVCANLRERVRVPIIVCSGAPRKDDAVLAFKLGAADFVAKPVALDELEIRIERAMRSALETVSASDQTVLTLGPLAVDVARRTVSLAGRSVPTTPTEYHLLTLLLQRADEVVSVADLAEAMWGRHDTSMEASIRVHLRRLRAKLRTAHAPAPALVAARGFGYRLTWDALDMAPHD
jgi:DNA-binding response OmpR family regulator